MYTEVPARGIDPCQPANLYLISPPDPVAAPLNGYTVVEKLLVSTLIEITDSKVESL